MRRSRCSFARPLIAGTVAALAVCSALAVAQSLKSTTYIEPAKAFLLGGGQPGAFSVKGQNRGPVPVTVFVERDGTRDSVTTLTPGAKLDAEFPARAMAVFRNESGRVGAILSITVRGNIRNLGMRYEKY